MRWITTSIALLVLAACASNSSTAPANEEFSLRSGRDAEIEQTGLHIRFLGVRSDSRCAVDVQCVWSGNAEVELDVRDGDITDTLVLNIHQGAKEGVVGNYRIVLVALSPEPRSGQTIDPRDYRVTLKVYPVGVVCTAEARPALRVTLSDSLTPFLESFTNVSVVATTGVFRDSVYVAAYNGQAPGSPISLAHETAGTYTVTVRAEGYKPWVKSGVEVQRDVCHVVTVPLTARLQK